MKLLLKNIVFVLSLLYAGNLSGQVEVSEAIIMTGTADSLKKINNLAPAIDYKDAINYKDYYSGRLRFATIIGFSGNSWNLAIPINIPSYNEGMMIYFIADTNNQGPTSININGMGIIELKKKINISLDTNDIIKNLPVLAIYDGINFQLISDINKKCPLGFIRVNENYCIQPIENDSSYFWPAAKHCGDLNAKLCNWGQWYYACQKASLGITDMTNNFEWIDAGGNYLTWTTPPATNTGLMVGEFDCKERNTAIVDPNHTHPRALPKTYRCCYEF